MVLQTPLFYNVLPLINIDRRKKMCRKIPAKTVYLNQMKKRLFLLLFVYFTLQLSGLDIDYQNFLFNVTGATGVDPNAGQTTFLTLLVPTGGRYESMGTAYTAVPRDSGFIHANPAGSSLLPTTELSLFHNDWIADSSLESLIYSIRFDQLGLGAGGKWFWVPFTGYDEFADRRVTEKGMAKGHYMEFLGTANVSYNFFHSYYFDGIALGANFTAGYRYIPPSVYAAQVDSTAVAVAQSDQNALTAMVDFGFMSRFNFAKLYYDREKNFSLGGAIQHLGPHVEGDPLPTRGRLGVSWSPLKPFLFSFDFVYPFFTPLSYDSNRPDKIAPEAPHIATGASIALADFYSLQSGIMLKQGQPRFTLGSAFNFQAWEILVNYTLDLTTQLATADRISIEAKIDLGDLGRLARKEKSQELYLEGLQEYAVGNIYSAIALWEECLELNPGFQPAREIMETAIRTAELQEQIEELERIEN